MKMLLGFLGTASLLAGATTAFADSECQKCTHDLQVKYRECRQTGRDQDTCSKEGHAAAQACVATCQARNPADQKPA
ncbi:MAG TPA: hypothetical protein VHZ74_16705 [Bryobacteraceae bacterium]|nr:hypothetical protein [Bryobacteraceae bacterium]